MSHKRKQKPRRLSMEKLESREMMAALRTVKNTTTYPARATVSLEQFYDFNRNGNRDSGETFICSGGLVQKRYVLTAAHCLYDQDRSMFATSVTVRPGRTPTRSPFGKATSTFLTVPTAWTQGNFLADIGVIKLNRPIGRTVGWYGFKAASTSQLNNARLFLRHYPGNPFSGKQQFVSSGHASNVSSAVISYNHNVISTFGGSSGAPLYLRKTNQIVGVHVRGSLGNSGPNQSTRITLPYFNLVKNAISGNQNQLQGATSQATTYGIAVDVEVPHDPHGISPGALLQLGADLSGATLNAVPDSNSAAASQSNGSLTPTNDSQDTAVTVTKVDNGPADEICLTATRSEKDWQEYESAADDLFAAVDEDLALVSEDLPCERHFCG